MSFIETPRFPDDISYGSTGGPTWSTDVLILKSGFESRNLNWQQARYSFNAGMGVRDETQLDDLINWFNAMQGMGHSFRFKDWTDYTSSVLGTVISFNDQQIGIGDAAEVDFQLLKLYTQGTLTRSREIKKPITGTVVIAFDAVEQTSGFTVDTTTGIVTFSVAPGAAVVITAGYEFDVPVRFASDELPISIDHFRTGSVTVPLIETRV